METYLEAPPLVANPAFCEQRRAELNSLDPDLIDPPLRPLVARLNLLPSLFTLQCCHGHFHAPDGSEIDRVDTAETGKHLERVDYRLAYLAFCIAADRNGSLLLDRFRQIAARVDETRVQFCSAAWFWNRQVNSYAVQVMPWRFRDRDRARLDRLEAVRVERARDALFPLVAGIAAAASR